MPAKILLVDDNRAILTMVKKYMTSVGEAVVMTDNGSEALMLIRDAEPDVILCDALMPGLDGHTLCRRVKQEAFTRSIPLVLMSGARITDKDVLAGFEVGADDYILKPFSLPVLHARLKAAMRRSKSAVNKDGVLLKCGIEINQAGRTVKVGKERISLTPKEFDLLALLLSKNGRILSIPYLLETVWGYDLADYNDPSTVEVHIYHLRKKLGPHHSRHIVNSPGHGYKFDEDPKSSSRPPSS